MSITKKKLLELPITVKPRGMAGVFVDDCFCAVISDYRTGEKRYCLDAVTLASYVVMADGSRCGTSLLRTLYRPYNCYDYMASNLDGINSDWPYTDIENAKHGLIKRLNELHGINLSSNLGIYRVIASAETLGSADRYRTAKLRKEQREAELEAMVPDIPDGFKEWCRKIAPHYYVRKDGAMTCSYCGNCVEETGLKQNGMYKCPSCGYECKVRKVEKPIRDKYHVTIASGAGEKRMVFRYFDVDTESSKDGTSICVNEKKRTFFEPGKKHEHFVQEEVGKFRERNPHVVKEGRSFLYSEEDVKSLFASSGYEDHARAAEAIVKSGASVSMELFMHLSGERNLYLFEMLVKGRFYSLAASALEQNRYRFGGCFGHDSLTETFPGVLGIERPEADFLRRYDGEFDMLVWLRKFKEEKAKPEIDLIRWLLDQKLVPANFGRKPKQMSMRQAVNYIKRMCGEEYRGMKATEVLYQWYDYLSMAKDEGKDLNDEMIYRPRELKKRHDQLVEQIAERKLRARERQNREMAEKRKAELDSKYPGAMINLDSVRERFEYNDGEYMILVPRSLSEIEYEGLMLGHCVAASSLYYDRIERNETYICFLRHSDCPNLPYYTVEVEPGGNVRQSRSEHDEQPNIEEIRKFLRKWQKHVKEAMTERDVALAEKSADLGRANLSDRLAKYGEHDRVYLALMEDFLEAGEEAV